MPELKVFALKKLDMIVDEFWPEISEAIEKMYVRNQYPNLFLHNFILHNILTHVCFILY